MFYDMLFRFLAYFVKSEEFILYLLSRIIRSLRALKKIELKPISITLNFEIL